MRLGDIAETVRPEPRPAGAPDAKSYAQSRATLAFLEPEMDAAYRAFFFDTTIGQVRRAGAALAAVFVLIWIWLTWITPNVFATTAEIAAEMLFWSRYILWLCLPVTVGIFALSWGPVARRFTQAAIGVVLALVMFGSVFAGRSVVPEMANYYSCAYLIIATFAIYAASKLRFVYATLLCWTGALAYIAFALIDQRPPTVIATNAYLLFLTNIGGMIAGYQHEQYARNNFVQRRVIEAREAELALERERAESLLLNILPAPIVERLKVDRATIADGIGDVSVLFADLVGFTALSANLAPTEVVDYLNRIFSRFDAIVETLGLEKIKTIGDAYMVAAGVPHPRPDHARAIAELALQLRESIAAIPSPRGRPVGLRIGINSGPVVAGVIGTKKFIYDLWGDTVNTASRMESHGAAGEIQVTESTYRQLEDEFVFGECRIVSVKGKGELKTWYLLGRKPA